MKRFLDLPAWPFCLLAVAIAALLLALIAGCGSTSPVRGSAQDDAIQKQARAATQRDAADAASRDAAALEAQAMLDAAAAQVSRIPSDIEKAAQSKAAAIVARAVANAEEATAAKAEVAAQQAMDAGRKERAKDAASEDARSWASLCRWFGLGSLVLGALIGVAVGYLVAPQLGIYLGGGIAGLGMLVVAFGATITWLPLVLAAGIVAALAIWAVYHARETQAKAALQTVSARLSHLVDTIEGNTGATITQAKTAVSNAIGRSGLAGWFDRLRAGWATTNTTLTPIAPELAPTEAIHAPVVSANGFPVATDPRASP